MEVLFSNFQKSCENNFKHDLTLALQVHNCFDIVAKTLQFSDFSRLFKSLHFTIFCQKMSKVLQQNENESDIENEKQGILVKEKMSKEFFA